MEETDIILTINGEEPAVTEITRHIQTLCGLCKCNIHVRTQSTMDLKNENAAIHKQCFKEQRHFTAVMKHLFENNHEIYNEICSWKDQDFENRYKEPVGSIKK